MASIFTTNIVTATVIANGDGSAREVGKDVNGKMTVVKSSDDPATITMHAADKAVLVAAGLVS